MKLVLLYGGEVSTVKLVLLVWGGLVSEAGLLYGGGLVVKLVLLYGGGVDSEAGVAVWGG